MLKLKGKSVVFLAGGIGDQLLHFPQIQHLAEITGQKVDLFCQHEKIMTDISKQCDWLGSINDIYHLKRVLKLNNFKTSILLLRQQHYSNAIVMHPSTTFKLASLLSGAKYRVGFPKNYSDKFLLNVLLECGSVADRETNDWGHRPWGTCFDHFLKCISTDVPDRPPILCDDYQTTEALKFFKRYPEPRILINLFSQDKDRCWPISQAVDFLTELVSVYGVKLFLSSGNDAKEWNRTFLANWPKQIPRPIEISKFISGINMEIALYCNADYYIGVNSFTSILSMNCNLPSLVLYNKKEDYINHRNNSIGVFPADAAPKKQGLEGIRKSDFMKSYQKLRNMKY